MDLHEACCHAGFGSVKRFMGPSPSIFESRSGALGKPRKCWGPGVSGFRCSRQTCGAVWGAVARRCDVFSALLVACGVAEAQDRMKLDPVWRDPGLAVRRSKGASRRREDRARGNASSAGPCWRRQAGAARCAARPGTSRRTTSGGSGPAARTIPRTASRYAVGATRR